MIRRNPAAPVLLALCGLVLPCAVHAQAFFEPLGFPAGTVETRALGVSPDGLEVVGYSVDGGGVRQAVRWTSPGGHQVGIEGELRAASTEGLVLFGNRRVGSGPFEAFTREGGTNGLLSVPVVDLGGGPIQATARAYGLSWDGRSGAGTGFAENITFPFVSVDGGFTALGFTGFGYGISGDGATVVGVRTATGEPSLAFAWSGGTPTLLGDLAGGATSSTALAASFDGSVVVGSSTSASGTEAFRWTGGTMTGLGDLPGGAFFSIAQSVSGDGTIVVGSGAGAAGSEAFHWTQAGGMRALKTVLETDYGFDLTGWTLTAAAAISGDGSVIVGHGTNPAGRTEAWMAVLTPKPPTPMAPTAGTRWQPGVNQTVTWYGGNSRTIDLLFRASDTAPVELVATNVERREGWFEVTIPSQAFVCARCRVGLRVTGGTPIAWGEPFSVKGYQLTRVGDAGELEAFRPSAHGWGFSNTEQFLFPASWWSAFDYGGIDPYTGLLFPEAFTREPSSGRPDFFPDWNSFVDAFGPETAYADRSIGHYSMRFAGFWAALRDGLGAWKGSCGGMAVSAMQIFADPAGASPRYGYYPSLYASGADPRVATNLRAAINAVQNYQYSEGVRVYIRAKGDKTATVTLDAVRSMLESDDPSDDRTLAMRAPGDAGGHVVVPYRVEPDPAGGGRYRILIYDPNKPGDDDAFVLVDTANDTWSYDGFSPVWGGTIGLFLLDPIPDYAWYARIPQEIAPKRSGAGMLEILAGDAETVAISGVGGSVTWDGSTAASTLAGAEILPNFVGGPAPPVSYLVPEGPTSIEVGGGASTSVLGGSTWFRASGRGAANAGLRVNVDGGAFSVSVPGDGSDSLAVEAIWPSLGSLLRADAVVDGDLEMTADPGRGAVVVTATGPVASFSVALLDDEGHEMRVEGVPVPEGAAVALKPDWTAGSSLTVETDADRDGVPESTTHLEANRVPTAAEPTEPAGGGTVLLTGDPATTLRASWTPGVDPDGDALEYRWELALDPVFSAPLASIDAGSATSVDVAYAELVGLLFSPGTPVGTAIDAYHRVVTRDGQADVVSAVVAVRFERGALTGVEEDGVPREVTLLGAYPNPFNPTTVLRFGLPAAGSVRLELFDVSGRRVRTLVDGVRTPGWHSVRLEADSLPSGAYVYRLTAGGRSVSRPVVLVR